MKTLLVFPGKVWGGAEQYVLDLGESLRERGHEVRFACFGVEALTSRLEGVKGVDILPKGGLYNRRLIKPLATIIREFRPDVVHIHNKTFVYPVTKAKEQARSAARIVLTYHDAHRNAPPFWQKGMFRRLHKMIFVSRFAYNRWHGANRWMPEELCVPIINSVKPQTSVSTPDETLHNRFGIDPATPLIVFSGRVRESKGCALIVEALGRLKHLPWAMVFVGGFKPANYQATLTKAAERLGIADRVHFYGFSRQSGALLRDADLGVAPSIMLDPCPLVPLEFLQLGKCVIVSDSGGQPEYVENGEMGIVVPRKDVARLAEAIAEMLEHPERRVAIGRAAGDHFSRHLSYTAFVDRILEAYQ